MGYEYYDYGYDYGVAANTTETILTTVVGFAIFIWIVALAISIFSIVCMWKVFKKAGKEGWASLIPIYNIIVLIQIAGVPMWYIALFFVPIGNIVVLFLIYIELAKKFGQSPAFGVGLVFLNPIFMAMLAFGKKYTYVGAPVQAQPVYNQPMQNNSQVVYNTQQPVQPVEPTEPVQPVQSVESSASVQPLNNQPQQENLQLQPINCKNCGAPVNVGDKFCMNCGTQL